MQSRCKPQESNMSKVIQSSSISSIIKNNTNHTVALFVPLVGRKIGRPPGEKSFPAADLHQTPLLTAAVGSVGKCGIQVGAVPHISLVINFPHEFLVLECQEFLAQMVPWRHGIQGSQRPMTQIDGVEKCFRVAKMFFCDPFHGRNIWVIEGYCYICESSILRISNWKPAVFVISPWRIIPLLVLYPASRNLYWRWFMVV